MKTIKTFVLLLLLTITVCSNYSMDTAGTKDYELYQNNAVDSEHTINIKFKLPDDNYVQVFAMDLVSGEKYELVDGNLSMGTHGVMLKYGDRSRNTDLICVMEAYSPQNTLLCRKTINLTTSQSLVKVK